MATNTALVKVLADNADLTRKLAQSERKLKGFERAAQRAGKNSGGAFKSLSGPLSTVMGLAGIGGVTMAFQSMIREASDSQRVAAQTAAVLKSTGGAAQVTAGHLSTLSGTLSQQIAVDDEVVQSAGNVLLTFTGIRNELGKGNNIFDQTLGLTADMSRAFGTDMNKAAIQLGKALNDPIKGVSALARVGVTFTAGQKEQIKSLMESGDLVGAQKIVLAELRKEIGGSAAAYGKTLPGSVEKLKIAWGNFLATVGNALAPAFEKAATAVTEAINALQGGKTPTSELGKQFVVIGRELKRVWDYIKQVITQVVIFGKKHPQIVRLVLALVAMRVAARLISFALPIKSTTKFLGVLGKLAQTKAGQAAVARIGTAFGGLWSKLRGTVATVGANLGNRLAAAGRSAGGRMGSRVSAGLQSKSGALVSVASRVGTAMGNALGIAARGAALVGFAAILYGYNNVLDRLRKRNKIVNVTGWIAQNVPVFGGQSLNQITGRAVGGVVTRPEVSLIGEAGPEAVIPLTKPRRARQVMRDAGLSGGGNNYFTINTTGPVDEVALARSIGWQLAARGLA